MYKNWKLFKTDFTYHTEIISMCGEVISQDEFKYYLETYGEIEQIDKSQILEVLSDGCSAGEYLNMSLEELKKDPHLNEIIEGIQNNESIPYPIFERLKDGKLVCMDGRHRLLIAMKINIVPSALVVNIIPANNDNEKEIKKFRSKYFKDLIIK